MNITISLDEYNDLKGNEIMTEFFGRQINELIECAELGYDKKSLRFDTDLINEILRVFYADTYHRKVLSLQEEFAERMELLNGGIEIE